MIDGASGLGLAFEARDAVGVNRERLGQHLDGDGALESLVARAVHLLAHTTGANQSGDLVGPQPRPRCKPHP